jgi:hypothetical protein
MLTSYLCSLKSQKNTNIHEIIQEWLDVSEIGKNFVHLSKRPAVEADYADFSSDCVVPKEKY